MCIRDSANDFPVGKIFFQGLSQHPGGARVMGPIQNNQRAAAKNLQMCIRDRPISTAKLNASRRLHTQPINLVVFKGSYFLTAVSYTHLDVYKRQI